MTCRTSLTALFLLLSTGASGQPAQPVRASSSADRTAVWVADRVTFTIELICAPGIDVLLDDVAKEKLRLNGLEVVSSDTVATTDASGRTTHRLTYVLTTYRVDMPSLSIEPLSVRYYQRRPGQRLQDLAPAGDVSIPGTVIAFRSTVPENQKTYAIRDTHAPDPRPWFFAHTRQVGLAAVIVALAPAAVIVAAGVRRRARSGVAQRSKRRVRVDRRATLERLRSLDVTTNTDRRRAYDEISAAVREHVAAHSHVSAAALTASELDSALASDGGRVPREAVTALLASCDEARYGPPDAVPSAQACREALSTAEQLLGGR
jgi:hypothetical protein